MFDIDHFKRVNDNYGHGVGDEVIRRVAALARDVVREADLLCRYGGEEFALLIADPGADRAPLVAERLRKQVAALTFTAPPQTNLVSAKSIAAASFQVTISLGVTLAPAGALREDGVTALLDRADQALYEAKRSGRNRTVTDHETAGAFAGPASPHDAPHGVLGDSSSSSRTGRVPSPHVCLDLPQQSDTPLSPPPQVANDG